MCAIGKDVFEVITYKRSALLELLNLVSSNDIELQEVLILYSDKKCTWIAITLWGRAARLLELYYLKDVWDEEW